MRNLDITGEQHNSRTRALGKGVDNSHFHLTLTMCFTLSFAFADFVSDIIFVFGESKWDTRLQIIAQLLFVLQLLVQLFAITGALTTLRKRFKAGAGEPYMNHIMIKLKCLKSFEIFVYPFIWILYATFMTILSVGLGLTKLLAIKQVQHWWLGWMIG